VTERPAHAVPGGRRPEGSPATGASPLGSVTKLLAAAAILLGCLAGPLALPARAHNSLVETSPADGATVDEAPEKVTLTFDQPVGRRFGVVVVTGPGGAAVQQGALQVSGRTATQPLARLERPGKYQVAWRVVSADGHPITGKLAFQVRTVESPGSPSPSATRPADATPTPGSAEETSAPAESASGDGDRQAIGWPLAVGVTAAVFIVTFGAGQLLRRRRGASVRAEETPDGH
jgi:copper resistance protein C